MRLILKNPEKYKGFPKHPIHGGKLRVEEAAIETGVDDIGYGLYIYFKGEKRFYTWSPSILGAKQCFAFQCAPKSKWIKI